MDLSLPAAFTARMHTLLGADYAAFAAAYDRPIQRGLRVNTLKASETALEAAFPLPLTPTAFAKAGFVLTGTVKAGADPLHHAGAYYMQEPSAMSAVTVLAPRPGEWVLDLCAAPGGKSTQIAAALKGQGLLWCNEYVAGRAAVLAGNLERCGVANAVVSQMDATPLCRKLAGQFDAVLADVPCSGEGMFRKEPAALADWSEAAVRRCAERAAGILDAAALAVAPGGRLVFSTCTFAPEENECQLARFLQRHPEFTPEPIDTPFGIPAFAADRVAAFDPGMPPAEGLTAARRILPPEGEGHFVALLRRSGTPAPRTQRKPADGSKPDPVVLAAAAVWRQCRTDEPGRLCRVGDTVRCLPDALPDTSGLHLIAAGIPVARWNGRRAEPAHGLFTAAGAPCRTVVALPLTDPRLTAFLRGEEIPVPDTLSGYCAVAVEAGSERIVTGFGKAVTGRLKNHYPKPLRLLS